MPSCANSSSECSGSSATDRYLVFWILERVGSSTKANVCLGRTGRALIPSLVDTEVSAGPGASEEASRYASRTGENSALASGGSEDGSGMGEEHVRWRGRTECASRRVCKKVVEGEQSRLKCSRTRLAVATVAFRHVSTLPWPLAASCHQRQCHTEE